MEVSTINRYFTGNPCKNGHIAERLISNRACIECLRLRKLDWQANNLEKLNTKKRVARAENPEEIRIYERERYRNDPRQKMLSAAKQRAKKKGISFNLKIEDIIIPTLCPLLEIPLIISSKKITDSSPSLDRIDNKSGYIKENIMIISYKANRCKNDLTLEEILKLANNLKKIMPEWLALEKGFI